MPTTYELLDDLIAGSAINLLSLANKIDGNSGTTSASVEASLDAVILAGQSNMVGWVPETGQIDSKIDYTDSRILQHSAFGSYANTLVLASDPLDHSDGRTGALGLGMSFSRKYIQNAPASTLILLPHGHGGTGFSDNQWKVGDVRTNALVANANALKSKFPDLNFKAILWHQGEKDVQGGVSQEQYTIWLTALVEHLRSAINGATDTPFIAGEISRQWIATQGAAGTAIQQALQDIPNYINKSAVASSDGLSVHDGIHFNAASNRILGVRYYEGFLAAQNHSISIADLSIPVDLSATPASNSASLNWVQNGTVPSSWIIEYKLASVGTWTSVTTNTRPYSLTGLEPLTSYNYRVKAVKSGVETEFSAVFTFSTLEVSSELPAGIPTPQFRLTFNNNDLSDSSGNNVTTTLIPLGAGTAGITNDVTFGNVFSTNFSGYLRVGSGLQPTYTKMCWVKGDQFVANGNLISSNLPGIHAWWFPNSQTHTGHNPGDIFVSSLEEFPFDGTWQHMALTFENGVFTFYRNSAVVHTTGGGYAAYEGAEPPNDIFIAMFDPNNNNGFNGSFKNVMVWDVALSLAEIQAIYNNENPL